MGRRSQNPGKRSSIVAPEPLIIARAVSTDSCSPAKFSCYKRCPTYSPQQLLPDAEVASSHLGRWRQRCEIVLIVLRRPPSARSFSDLRWDVARGKFVAAADNIVFYSRFAATALPKLELAFAGLVHCDNGSRGCGVAVLWNANCLGTAVLASRICRDVRRVRGAQLMKLLLGIVPLRS